LVLKIARNYDLLIHRNFSTPVSTNWQHFSIKINYEYWNANFVIYQQNISIYWHERAPFHTNTMTVLKSWMCLPQRESWQTIPYPRTITRTLSTSGSGSPSKHSTSTAICTWKLTSCWSISLKTFMIIASRVMDSIPRITTFYLVLCGMRC